MSFSGKIGDTFTLRENPSFRGLNVILTEPNNNGKVVVIPFGVAVKRKQAYEIFSGKDHELFMGNKIPRYLDARLKDHQNIVILQNDNPDRCKGELPQDIIRRVIDGAFRARQSSTNVLDEIARQYPVIANKYGYTD